MVKSIEKYVVFWVGGDRDGEELFTSESENDAIRFARKFLDEHEDEFDPVCGSVGIMAEYSDGTKEDVMDW